MSTFGKIALVDLTNRKVETKTIPNELRRAYLGGRGINMYFLYKLVRPSIDPLGPDNPLIIGTGVLSGTPGWGFARMNFSGKSPESGLLGDSNIGGELAAELKYTGYDHIVITGASASPVYLWINNDNIEIRDAGNLWGLNTLETHRRLRKDLGSNDVKIACIGPAGENKVRFASIISGWKNAAGRTGMGALMGSKRLKAVVARGTKDVPIAYPQEYMEHIRGVVGWLQESRWVKTLGHLGTPLLLGVGNTLGNVGVRNHQISSMGERGKRLEAENVLRYSTGMTACVGCVVHCRHRHEIKEGRWAGTRGEGPENGAIALGANLDCVDLPTVIYVGDLCNLYGVDVDAFAQMTGWAMELYQRGIIGQSETGMPLEWGNGESIVEMVHMVANRRGFGDVLANGVGAPDVIGRNSGDYLMRIKNRQSMGTDERVVKSFALGVSTSTRGFDHLRSRPGIDLYRLPKEFLRDLYGGDVNPDYLSYEGKERMVWWHEQLFAIGDSLGSCIFQQVFNSPNLAKFEDFSKILYLAAGLDLSKEDLMTIGERIYTTERLYLVREGIRRGDDYPPEKYLTEPTVAGKCAGAVIDPEQYDRMLDRYYELHGWDADGVPLPETVDRLGICSLLETDL